MFVIDFEKLKIEKEYHTVSVHSTLTYGCNGKEAVQQVFNNLQVWKNLDFLFEIEDAPETVDADDFLHMVNMILAFFFKELCLDKGRNREHRMDVPENFKGLHASLASLKKAVNLQTKCNRFNISIRCGNFYYILCDTKETPEPGKSSFERYEEETTNA